MIDIWCIIREKNVTNTALLWCKTFSLKIWLCKILDKYHVWVFPPPNITLLGNFSLMANNYHEVRQYDFSIYIIIWEKSAGITKKYLLVNTLSNYFRTVSDRKKFFLCLWWIPFYSPPPPPLSFRRNILIQNLISFTSMWSRWPTPCFWFHR